MTEPDQSRMWAQAARAGDRLALAKLLAAHYPRLRARAEAGMDPPMNARYDPDDILQDVYLDLARQLPRFEHHAGGSFLNWVLTILDHKLVDAWRAAHCQARDVGREIPAQLPGADSCYNLLDVLFASSGTPSRAARRDEALAALSVCLAHLSDPHRQVLELRFLQGLPVADVARHLHRSEAAVVALTKRALAALRESMDRLGEFTRDV